MNLYILKNRTPVKEPDLMKWGAWMQKNDRHVAETQIKGYNVSTVFLGLDHSYSLFGGEPILFETMVFNYPRHMNFEDHPFSSIQERYSTWDEAEVGHKRIVAEVMGMRVKK